MTNGRLTVRLREMKFTRKTEQLYVPVIIVQLHISSKNTLGPNCNFTRRIQYYSEVILRLF